MNAAKDLNASPSPITLSKKALFTRIGIGFVVASIVAFGAILPAEFHYDPLGVGKATGLLGLSKPQEEQVAVPNGPTSIAHSYAVAFRTDTIEIPLTADGEIVGDRLGAEIEYKVKMKKDATLVYSWTVENGTAEEFYFDFHGESPPKPEVQVMSFKEAVGLSSHGSLIAPFDGIHGWYFQNQSVKPVVVRLKLSGFYELHDMSQPVE